MTFSIAGVDPVTGEVGVAISSSSPAVAARCAHVLPGVGAACSQNITDPRLGPVLLRALTTMSASDALAHTVNHAGEAAAFRQLTVVSLAGGSAAISGAHTLGVHETCTGPTGVAGGNLLASTDVPHVMLHTFEKASGPLGTKLVAALTAGLAAGGEAGPVRSAGLLVARTGVDWPVTDLRVDWDDSPIAELQTLWDVWLPQLEDYITRGLDPARSPGFGVPGDNR